MTPVRVKGFEGMACSMAEVMHALGDRWGALIMRDLLLGLSRYEDLRRSTGITNATLSDRLKALEGSGLIERRQYQERPLRYDYVPTSKGRDLALLMQAMVQIGDKWRLADQKQAPLLFVDGDSGSPLQVILADEEATAATQPRRVAILPGPAADDLMRWRMATGSQERLSRSERQSSFSDGN